MATREAIKKLATQWNMKRVFSTTPKLRKKSKTKPVSNFYGQPIAKGALHKRLGIPQGQKIPLSIIRKKLAALKKKKNKTAAEVKKERQLVFAANAKTRWNKK